MASDHNTHNKDLFGKSHCDGTHYQSQLSPRYSRQPVFEQSCPNCPCTHPLYKYPSNSLSPLYLNPPPFRSRTFSYYQTLSSPIYSNGGHRQAPDDGRRCPRPRRGGFRC